MILRYTTLLGLLALLLLPRDAAAAGKCEVDGSNGAAILAARDAVRTRCDCAGATSHGAYLRCVSAVVLELGAAGDLPLACRGRVKQFAANSVCGRSDRMTCCVKVENGSWRARIARKSDGCRAPRNGAACDASFPLLGDACLAASGCHFCGDGVVNPDTEGCEPPNTPTCDASCSIRRVCGNGVVDGSAGEQCEPPGTATCDAACHFIATCGNGVIEPGEECDGQAGCTEGCTLSRAICCDFGDQCLGGSAKDDFDAYFNFAKPCFQVLGGEPSYGVCQGTQSCSPPLPPGLDCRVGSCGDAPIAPLPLCCQQFLGGCRAIVATSVGEIGGFGCSSFPPPDQGDVDRLMLGTCGADGRCVPAS